MDIVKCELLLPTLKLDDQKFEFIFLIDRSGSMDGQSIELAKRALKLLLHSLPADCYFNIISFGSNYSSMFSQSVKYSETTLQKAKQNVDAMRADMGGTDIYKPLNYIYTKPHISGYLAQIFAITDGVVDNTGATLQLVGSKVTHSRLFALGIGDSVSRSLVKGIALNGGGTSEFVTSNEKIESKILHQLKISQRPAILKPILDSQSSHIFNLTQTIHKLLNY